jgi:hypothetical protein
MLLHLDGSRHRWFPDDRWKDLRVVPDDATSHIYYAPAAAGWRKNRSRAAGVMAALQEVIEQQRVFCAHYSDRASHFFETPKASGPVDRRRLTQVGRALKELGVEMIPAYSPQARGRRERNSGTWQGRLPQVLRLAGIGMLEEANRFLREHYIGEFNRRFAVPAAERGSAILRLSRLDLDRLFSIQHARVVNRDNTVSLDSRVLQIELTRWRGTLAGCRVTVCEHLVQPDCKPLPHFRRP